MRQRAGVGAVIALIALVVVLVGSLVAYDALSAARARGVSVPLGEGTAADADTSSASRPGAQMLSSYDATVYDEGGSAVSLTQIAAGRPLVINFWATWCPYCVQELPDYQQLYEEYGDRVAFAFVDCADGDRETVEGASAWLLDNGYMLPAYYDTTLEATYALGAWSLPTTVVVSADGEILAISAGMIDPALMREALDALV